MIRLIKSMLTLLLGFSITLSLDNNLKAFSKTTFDSTINSKVNKTVKLQKRTTQEIIDKHLELMIPYDEEITKYEITPSSSHPYNKGSLNLQYLEMGINSVNFYRYLAGLPDDIEISKEFQNQVEHAVVLIDYMNNNSKDKPSDMSDDFFEVGSYGIETSSSGKNFKNLSTFVSSLISDSSKSNRTNQTLGHRRLILNPQLQYTGIAEFNGNFALKLVDKSEDFYKKNKIDYNEICWPSASNFPLEYFSPTDLWSISLNPEIYDTRDLSNITIKLTKLNDNKVWILNKNTINETFKDTPPYFGIDTSSYGIPNAIIFRPGDIKSFSNGDIFKVEVRGLKLKSGQGTNLTYEVSFFNVLGDYQESKPKEVNYEKLNTFVDNFYKYGLNREPDIEGKQYWIDSLASSELSARFMIFNLLNEDEFINSSSTSEEFISNMFNLLLMRGPSKDEITYWISEYNKKISSSNKYDAKLFIIKSLLNEGEFIKLCSTMGVSY